MRDLLRRNKGSVLIMVLWALALLTVFTVQVSLTAQDRIAFLSRADRRATLRHASQAGVYKAIAVIKKEIKENPTNNPLQRSMTLFYNPESFKDINMGPAQVNVGYKYFPGEQYINGITDEERRINLNTASRQTIEKLVSLVINPGEKEADSMAGSLMDWRQLGDTEIEGFFSDEFYENLEFPYEEKKKDYETLDEIRLVKGITEPVFEKLRDYVTVYGTGEVNINTAPWAVLVALGFTEEQAGIIEGIRRGADGIIGTPDDFFFASPDTLSQKLIEVQGMEGPDVAALDRLFSTIKLTVTSSFFRIESVGQRPESRENNRITCVFDPNSDKIIYWHER